MVRLDLCGSSEGPRDSNESFVTIEHGNSTEIGQRIEQIRLISRKKKVDRVMFQHSSHAVPLI